MASAMRPRAGRGTCGRAHSRLPSRGTLAREGAHPAVHSAQGIGHTRLCAAHQRASARPQMRLRHRQEQARSTRARDTRHHGPLPVRQLGLAGARNRHLDAANQHVSQPSARVPDGLSQAKAAQGSSRLMTILCVAFPYGPPSQSVACSDCMCERISAV
jgi:hypothetical protein